MGDGLQKLWKTEDYWAVWLGLGLVLVALVGSWTGHSIDGWAVKPGGWSSGAELSADLARQGPGLVKIFLLFAAVFTVSAALMGHRVSQFIPGFVLLFLSSTAVFYLSGWSVTRRWDLDAPLLALLIGLSIGNLVRLPEWLRTSLRTEYYIKTGIVLLGATLPLTLIWRAGWVAFLQATVVSVTTWLTIYLAATRLFKLEPQFGAVLGAGGAVCGVSASIAVGGAVKAHKDHIAIGIAVVSLWAIVMILVLSFALKLMVPGVLSPGEAGAWVGTSEFADAAGFAVVAELSADIESGAVHAAGGGRLNPDDPINTFTLMKVIGRDIWIGIWCLILSVVSVVWWEKAAVGARAGVGAGIVWERFPKFVLGFLAASVLMTAVTSRAPADYVGRAPVKGTFRSGAEKIAYDADFSGYAVPPELRDRFAVSAGMITFRGRMTVAELELLKGAVAADDQNRKDKVAALKQLQLASDWYEGKLVPKVVGPIKNLRTWAFVLCFLCIGLQTRFAELLTFGLQPLWAFTIGVVVNVPLGYFLSTVVFSRFWSSISSIG